MREMTNTNPQEMDFMRVMKETCRGRQPLGKKVLKNTRLRGERGTGGLLAPPVSWKTLTMAFCTRGNSKKGRGKASPLQGGKTGKNFISRAPEAQKKRSKEPGGASGELGTTFCREGGGGGDNIILLLSSF